MNCLNNSPCVGCPVESKCTDTGIFLECRLIMVWSLNEYKSRHYNNIEDRRQRYLEYQRQYGRENYQRKKQQRLERRGKK